MKLWLILLALFCPVLLSAQDSTRAFTSVHTDSTRLYYTRVVHDTVAVPDTTPTPGCVSTATALCPGDAIQAKVTAAPTGTAFTLAPGMYRLQSVTPKAGDSFTGTGAVVSGAILVTGWTQAGASWSAQVSYTPGTVSGQCASGALCQTPNDVYWDDALLRTGYTLTATTLTVIQDPTGHRVELASLPKAFGGSAANVTLTGFAVEKYANPYNSGAVHVNGTNWAIAVEARWNHGAGIGLFGSGNRIVGGRLHHNGQYGCMANGVNQSLVGTEVDHNNTAGFDQSWAAGGCKMALTTGLLVRGNFFHDNLGHALWVDIGNYQAVIELNTIADNLKRGIFYEIGYDAIIRNNTLNRNGLVCSVALRCGGIGVVSSSNVEVYDNTLTGNRDGITGVQDARGSGSRGLYSLTNLKVHDNTVNGTLLTAGGLIQTVNDNTYYTTKGNLWSKNIYNGSVSGTPFYWNNGNKTQAQWTAAGQQ